MKPAAVSRREKRDGDGGRRVDINTRKQALLCCSAFSLYVVTYCKHTKLLALCFHTQQHVEMSYAEGMLYRSSKSFFKHFHYVIFSTVPYAIDTFAGARLARLEKEKQTHNIKRGKHHIAHLDHGPKYTYKPIRVLYVQANIRRRMRWWTHEKYIGEFNRLWIL